MAASAPNEGDKNNNINELPPVTDEMAAEIAREYADIVEATTTIDLTTASDKEEPPFTTVASRRRPSVRTQLPEGLPKIDRYHPGPNRLQPPVGFKNIDWYPVLARDKSPRYGLYMGHSFESPSSLTSGQLEDTRDLMNRVTGRFICPFCQPKYFMANRLQMWPHFPLSEDGLYDSMSALDCHVIAYHYPYVRKYVCPSGDCFASLSYVKLYEHLSVSSKEHRERIPGYPTELLMPTLVPDDSQLSRWIDIECGGRHPTPNPFYRPPRIPANIRIQTLDHDVLLCGIWKFSKILFWQGENNRSSLAYSILSQFAFIPIPANNQGGAAAAYRRRLTQIDFLTGLHRDVSSQAKNSISFGACFGLDVEDMLDPQEATVAPPYVNRRLTYPASVLQSAGFPDTQSANQIVITQIPASILANRRRQEGVRTPVDLPVSSSTPGPSKHTLEASDTSPQHKAARLVSPNREVRYIAAGHEDVTPTRPELVASYSEAVANTGSPINISLSSSVAQSERNVPSPSRMTYSQLSQVGRMSDVNPNSPVRYEIEQSATPMDQQMSHSVRLRSGQFEAVSDESLPSEDDESDAIQEIDETLNLFLEPEIERCLALYHGTGQSADSVRFMEDHGERFIRRELPGQVDLLGQYDMRPYVNQAAITRDSRVGIRRWADPIREAVDDRSLLGQQTPNTSVPARELLQVQETWALIAKIAEMGAAQTTHAVTTVVKQTEINIAASAYALGCHEAGVAADRTMIERNEELMGNLRAIQERTKQEKLEVADPAHVVLPPGMIAVDAVEYHHLKEAREKATAKSCYLHGLESALLTLAPNSSVQDLDAAYSLIKDSISSVTFKIPAHMDIRRK